MSPTDRPRKRFVQVFVGASFHSCRAFAGLFWAPRRYFCVLDSDFYRGRGLAADVNECQ